jgi:hypothetical protein
LLRCMSPLLALSVISLRRKIRSLLGEQRTMVGTGTEWVGAD